MENSKGECNFGQHEINFAYGPALRTADEHAIYKNGAKEIAAQEGMAITYMAKFDEREGNSCHIHLSLRREDGSALFADDRARLRRLPGRAARLPARSCACSSRRTSTPTSASPSGSFAPTAVAWGEDNRTCSLRVVGHGASRRVECRLAGADVNPYLALSAMIAAGLHGMDAALDPGPPFEGNAYESDKPRVPRTLRDARDAFAASTVAREAFGEDVVDHYLNAAAHRARGVRRRGDRLGARARLRAAVSIVTPRPSVDTVFAPVQSQTAFEETLERLGTAIKLGLLEPGARLPAERELCLQLGISRSTLRQALTALVQCGHLHATRGRSGGTFVADAPPPVAPPERARCWPAGATRATSGSPSSSPSRCWPRSARRSTSLAPLDELVRGHGRRRWSDFPAFRQADVRWHIGLAEATGSPRLVVAR